MLRRPELWAALLALATPATAQADGWRLVFEDEFSGGTLDRSAWATRYIYSFETTAYLDTEIQRFADNGNHVVKDGVLSLIARPKAKMPGGARFESGMIRSRRTFYYGYFEARVFLPTAKGVFPAFWLNPDYNADGETRWPPEIDGFEYVQNKNENPSMIHSAVRTSKGNPQGGEYLYRNPRFAEKHGVYRATAPLNKSWQTIGLLWKPDSVTSYLNGEKLWTRRFRWLDKFGEFAPPAHVLLNFAVGGGWAGEGGVDAANFPQQFKIDYVRVCQFASGRDTGPTCGDSQFTPSLAEGRYKAAGDMPRSYLIFAKVTPSRSGRFSLRMGLRATPTSRDQLVNLVATDKRGKSTLIAGFRPSQPSSQWGGPIDMVGRFCAPPSLKPGDYDLWLGIGSPDGKGDWRNIPLTAAESFGIRSGHLRYRIGSMAITDAAPPATGPCKRANG